MTIEALIELTRQSTGVDRRTLLSQVADVFVDETLTYSGRELDLFAEIIGMLLDQVDVDARADLAGQVAASGRPVARLYRKLASDDIRVADPILTRCPHLDERMLVDLASTQSQQHMAAIARREHVSVQVTDVLIARGDATVLRTVTGNLGAEISPTSFEVLADHAEHDPALQRAMSYRGEMPLAVAERLLDVLPEHHRLRLLQLMADDPEAADTLVETAGRKASEARLKHARQRLQTKAMMAQIADGTLDLDSAVILLAREGRYQNLAMLLAASARLAEETVLANLLKVDPQPLIVMMRALDMQQSAVAAIADMRGRRLNLPESMKHRMIAIWQSLEKPLADKILVLARLRQQ